MSKLVKLSGKPNKVYSIDNKEVTLDIVELKVWDINAKFLGYINNGIVVDDSSVGKILELNVIADITYYADELGQSVILTTDEPYIDGELIVYDDYVEMNITTGLTDLGFDGTCLDDYYDDEDEDYLVSDRLLDQFYEFFAKIDVKEFENIAKHITVENVEK